MSYNDDQRRFHKWSIAYKTSSSLQGRHNEPDGVSNLRRFDCLPNCCSGTDQRKHQSSASLAFVRGLHWPHFYQTRSAWSMDHGSNENHSPFNNFIPTVTKFCVLWEGQALPQDTKFGNGRNKIVDSRAFISWSLIHGSSWSGLIKLGPCFQAYTLKPLI